MRPEAELQYEPVFPPSLSLSLPSSPSPLFLLPPALLPPSFLGGRLLAEGDSFKFCLGKQQINLLQHMLGSLISSREIRLRGRGTRRVGRKNTAAMKDEDDDDDGLSLCSDDWWRWGRGKSSFVSQTRLSPSSPHFPPSSSAFLLLHLRKSGR